MAVTVLVPGVLRAEVEGAARLSVDATGTLRAVLDEVGRRWPRLERRIRDESGAIRRFVNVYVDGEDCRLGAGLDTPVVDGAEVQVLPSVAGGAALTPADGDAILAGNFAPWVQDLGLVVEEVGERHAVLRLPWSARLAREGGALSGQALMAAADTSTVIAISAARGGYGPMTTVQQSTTFQRPVTGSDTVITARVSKLGRTLAFVDVTMTSDGAVAAQASTVYAVSHP